MHLDTSPIWSELVSHQNTWKDKQLKHLFAEDQHRFSEFSLELEGLLYDYSKQKVSKKTISLLLELAKEAQLEQAIEALFAGAPVNNTENRPALHMALRDAAPSDEIKAVLSQMEMFVNALHSDQMLGVTDKPIRHVISLGIGGSDLGPRMVCQALASDTVAKQNIHFFANVDGQRLESLLDRLDPAETLVIINSKSYTTIETFQNAEVIRQWFSDFSAQAFAHHAYAVTAMPARAISHGIAADHIFPFWEWVGGRYSVWSAVGLPIAIQLGMEKFKAFLAGAHAMDCHFQTAPWAQNMPILMALIGIWNRNFWHLGSQAIIPYGDALEAFPAYLQQLEMESNGKAVSKDGQPLNKQTQPVIWGGVGCNGQHAYMQLLHQGTEEIPIDFIVAASTPSRLNKHHELLVASCLGQSQALMLGRDVAELSQENDHLLSMARMCPGNRPSSTLVLDSLSPYQLGQLIALYEHKVYVQGVIWGVQSFDQWGVELGKQLIKDILPALEGDIPLQWDSSTKGLLTYIRNRRVS